MCKQNYFRLLNLIIVKQKLNPGCVIKFEYNRIGGTRKSGDVAVLTTKPLLIVKAKAAKDVQFENLIVQT